MLVPTGSRRGAQERQPQWELNLGEKERHSGRRDLNEVQGEREQAGRTEPWASHGLSAYQKEELQDPISRSRWRRPPFPVAAK